MTPRKSPLTEHDRPLPQLADYTPPALASEAPTPRAPKSVKWAPCPSHGLVSTDSGNTGLVPQGRHLAWRDHDVVMQGGARQQCRASGLRYCEHRRDTDKGTCSCEL
jgi:hypothetical protein